MVNSYTWFILDGRKGMVGMTLEEKAVYRDILDLIYQKNGQVPDDDMFIARWIGCDIRVWRRIKATLIAKDRVFIYNGFICDQKAQERVAKEVAMATSRFQNSLLGGTANKGKWNQIKGKSNTYESRADSRPDTAERIAPSYLERKKDLSSSVTTSEHLQPSQELLEIERKKRSAQGELATALLDGALARPAYAAASTKAARDRGTRKFSRAEVGKPNGWDWDDAPKDVPRETHMNEQPGGVINETPTAQSRATKH